MKQAKIQNNITMLVREHPELANNRKALIKKYWEQLEGAKQLTDILHCTPAESITRAFRKLVEEGEVQVDGKVQQMRLEMEEEFREFYK